jgi:DNA repair exonuclease SbcCD nuclease subunit
MRRLTIGQLGDSHVHLHSRFAECMRLHEWIVDDMARRGVALVAHTGDLYEQKSVPEERNAAERIISKCADFAPFVIIRGNHDVPGDLAIMRRLRTRYPVIVEEGAGTVLVAASAASGAPNQPIGVACLSWPRKANLLAQLAQPVSPEQSSEVAQEALRDVLRGLGQELDQMGREKPNLLLAHAMMRGAVTSAGQPLVGRDMELDLTDLGLVRAKYVGLGHIHMPQEWKFGGAWNVFAGSPRRTAYGENEDKGYVLVHFDEASDGWHCAGFERITVPATPMLDVVSAWKGEGEGLTSDVGGWDNPAFLATLRGADVRFRYAVPADAREPARLAAEALRQRFLDAGAVNVTSEPEAISQTRARAPEIVEALTTWDKLQTLWRLRQVTHPDARVARLKDKVTELENESHAVFYTDGAGKPAVARYA